MNYRQIPALLAARKPFKGNSMSAEVQPDGAYVVRSYSTIIATAHGTQVAVSDVYYSRTTSRHQNLCKAWLR